MKFINKLQKFMYGRYGVDELYKFLMIIYIIILTLNLILKSKLLSILELIIIFSIFYRAFSKNTRKRKKENNQYLKLKNKIKNIFQKKYKDKNYIYKKCSKCKTTLKLPLPYEIGIKHTKCPKCKHRNRILILRRQKIEIIKNKKAK